MLTLTVGGLRLPLEVAPDGVRIADPGEELEVLAWLLNTALSGWLPVLRGQLERGEDAINQPIVAIRAPAEELGDAGERWRRATGTDPGDDVYLVGNGFAPNLAVPRAVLLELLDRVAELRDVAEVAGDPAASLFSEEPAGAGDPGEGERAYLEELERRAADLDAIAREPRTPERVAEEHAKRRVLLASLEASGLLSDELWEAKRRWLEAWELPNLLAYLDSAGALVAYLQSDERRERVPDAAAQPVLGAPISVDWFRLGVSPQEGLSPFEWLAYCEYVFRRQELPAGSEGEFRIRAGGPWYRFRWRKDNGVTPALFGVAVV